jgi:hypothetical protein
MDQIQTFRRKRKCDQFLACAAPRRAATEIWTLRWNQTCLILPQIAIETDYFIT